MLSQFLPLIEKAKIVLGLGAIVPSTSTPDFVSLKAHQKLTVIIISKNATTVTGSAITLKQATVVAGTDEKALAFTKRWTNADIAAADTLVETAVTSNTFTTQAVNSKTSIDVLEVDADDLDADNGFDCVRAGTGDATAATLTVLYILHAPRYAPGIADAAITD
ncbi:MAG: hypothetical protein WC718_17735 [Phycisphaerales bacterium]|jgi:hypothetical protein